MTKITITIQLFGAFRKYFANNKTSFSVAANSDLAAVRKQFSELIKQTNTDARIDELIKTSAFATDGDIIQDDFCFDADIELAVLPPVCGG